jgi:hypothetical protein
MPKSACNEASANTRHIELRTGDVYICELIEWNLYWSVVAILADLVGVSLSIVHSNKAIHFREVCQIACGRSTIKSLVLSHES